MTANRIIAHVFLQPSLQLVNEAAMEQLVADHPYFSAARLLLARKVYQQTGNLHHPAVKKALLYSAQHHYAYQLITAEQVLQVVENRVAAVIPEDALPEELVEELAITAEQEEEEPVAIHEREEELSLASIVTDPEAGTFTAEPETVTTAPEEEENIALASVTETAHTPEYHTTAPETEAPIAVADFEPGGAGHTATVEVLPPPVVMPAATNGQDNGDHVEVADGDSSGPIKIFPMAAAEEETELIFQPLYTDDYFAYKRLKNPEEADDLNEQGAADMKSFTSWLRQMKDNFAGKTSKDWYHQQLHRMYEEDEEPEVSETVEKMAMDSIVFNNDIVSETLAEIWVRQQQYGNAIKIYQKLSLLNPDKNAYFAQKILELKSKTDKNKQ
jgi:tetratricopeptide (TPR) repeat protein